MACGTLRHLANHIKAKYGENWHKQLKRKDADGCLRPIVKKAKSSVAPDLKNQAYGLGFLCIGKERYWVYDSPRDESCYYHSFSAMIRPHLEESSSASASKAVFKGFYKDCTGDKRRTMRNCWL